MEQDTTNNDALKARRDALRERLRAKCDLVIEAVEALPDPKTFIDAERAARTVMVADKMILQVFSEPKVVKEATRFGAGYGYEETRRGVSALSENHAKNAPSATSSPIGFAAPPPPPSFAFAGEDDLDQAEDETPLSKTYLKMEQIVAKITALDAEICGQNPSKQGP